MLLIPTTYSNTPFSLQLLLNSQQTPCSIHNRSLKRPILDPQEPNTLTDITLIHPIHRKRIVRIPLRHPISYLRKPLSKDVCKLLVGRVSWPSNQDPLIPSVLFLKRQNMCQGEVSDVYIQPETA